MKDLGRGEAEQVSDCQQEEMKLALETADRFHLACTKHKQQSYVKQSNCCYRIARTLFTFEMIADKETYTICRRYLNTFNIVL